MLRIVSGRSQDRNTTIAKSPSAYSALVTAWLSDRGWPSITSGSAARAKKSTASAATAAWRYLADVHRARSSLSRSRTEERLVARTDRCGEHDPLDGGDSAKEIGGVVAQLAGCHFNHAPNVAHP